MIGQDEEVVTLSRYQQVDVDPNPLNVGKDLRETERIFFTANFVSPMWAPSHLICDFYKINDWYQPGPLNRSEIERELIGPNAKGQQRKKNLKV